jgi:ribosomal 50S subunit-recycling heat shock protein
MRVDLALKYLCLVKSRSSVKHLCDDEAVLVNDHPAKPSTTLRTGDKVSIRFANRILTIELVDVPEKQLSKSLSAAYYRKTGEAPTGDEDVLDD